MCVKKHITWWKAVGMSAIAIKEEIQEWVCGKREKLRLLGASGLTRAEGLSYTGAQGQEFGIWRILSRRTRLPFPHRHPP